MRKRCITFTILLMVIMLTGYGWAETQTLTVSTGSMGGGFYPIGGGIAAYISKNVPNVRATAVTSGGVNENITRLNMKTADIALVSSGDSYAAFRGIPPYKKKYDKMRSMGVLYRALSQNYCLKKSGIKTYADLRGKTACGGAPGGTLYKFLIDIVGIHGIDAKKDMKVVFMPHKDALDAVKTGQVDAAFINPTIPAPVIVELSLTHDVQLIRFGPGLRDKLVKEKPKYLPMTVPAGTYKGIDEDVETIGMAVLWACREDLPDDLVYQIVKAIYSPGGLAHLGKVHRAAKGIRLENAAKWVPFPIHPGAERFFKEKGLL